MPELAWLPVINVVKNISRTSPYLRSNNILIPKGLMIHHEGSNTAHGSSASNIAYYHVVTKKWGKIAYHFVIERDGTIYQTLELTEEGPHSGYSPEYGDKVDLAPEGDPQYYNKYYLAACIVGNDPTPQQYQSLASLIVAFKIASPLAFEVLGHKHAPGKATACPGRAMDFDHINDLVNQMLAFRTGDPFFDQFQDWRTRAINAKGVADQAIDELRSVRDELVQLSGAISELNRKVSATIERANKIVGAV